MYSAVADYALTSNMVQNTFSIAELLTVKLTTLLLHSDQYSTHFAVPSLTITINKLCTRNMFICAMKISMHQTPLLGENYSTKIQGGSNMTGTHCD
jgi:hypothetical protein